MLSLLEKTIDKTVEAFTKRAEACKKSLENVSPGNYSISVHTDNFHYTRVHVTGTTLTAYNANTCAWVKVEVLALDAILMVLSALQNARDTSCLDTYNIRLKSCLISKLEEAVNALTKKTFGCYKVRVIIDEQEYIAIDYSYSTIKAQTDKGIWLDLSTLPLLVQLSVLEVLVDSTEFDVNETKYDY